MPAAFAMATLTLQCTWPGGIRGLVIDFIGTFKELRVGPNTNVFYLTSDEWAEKNSKAPSLDSSEISETFSRPYRSGGYTEVPSTFLRFESMRTALKE